MRNILGIARREFGVAFSSPLAYIVLGVFLLVCGLKFFFFPGVFFSERASFRTFFDWMPAFLSVLAPALTMRLLAEEKKTGTLELLMTLPVNDAEVAVGKWLAASGIIAVGLLFTVLNALAIAPLAAPGQGFDWGPVVGGYAGTLLLSSTFVATGLFFSSLTKNQVISFILAVVVCGINLLLNFAIVVLPASVGEVVQYLSAYYHFESLGRGVIDWRDLLFFVSVTTGLLVMTTGVISGHRRVGSDVKQGALTALTIGILVFVNLFAVRLPLRVDLTRNHEFTLSEATKETMKGLESPVTITAYFTSDLPPPFSDNARYVKDLLSEYRAVAGDNLSFSFVDPQAEETAEDKEIKKDVKQDIFGNAVREKTSVEKELEGVNIQPVEVRVLEQDQAQTKRAYMGIAIRYGEEKESLPVVQDTSTLEYDLTSLIRRLTRTKPPVLAVIQGHGEPNPDEALQRIKQALEQNYEVRPVTLGSGSEAKVPDDVDAALIIGPNTGYSDDELKAIDEFVMRGKGAGFLLDRTQVDLKTLQPTPMSHNVDKLTEKYGLELGTQVVGDVSCMPVGVGERRGNFVIQRQVPYPFIPRLKNLEGDSPLTRGIVDVTLPFAAPVYTKKLDGVETTVLGKSSSKSWIEDATPEGFAPARDWGAAPPQFTGPYDLIATARGSLPSFADETKKSTGEARVFLIGTSTMLNEQVLSPPNASLFFNLVDWLTLDAKMLAMRSRGAGEAPFAPDLADGTRNAVKFGCTAGVPALLVLLGLVRWQLREARRKRLAVVAP
jgi:gliding-associated putative ABC transporter substrate-binding component GldG